MRVIEEGQRWWWFWETIIEKLIKSTKKVHKITYRNNRRENKATTRIPNPKPTMVLISWVDETTSVWLLPQRKPSAQSSSSFLSKSSSIRDDSIFFHSFCFLIMKENRMFWIPGWEVDTDVIFGGLISNSHRKNVSAYLLRIIAREEKCVCSECTKTKKSHFLFSASASEMRFSNFQWWQWAMGKEQEGRSKSLLSL